MRSAIAKDRTIIDRSRFIITLARVYERRDEIPRLAGMIGFRRNYRVT